MQEVIKKAVELLNNKFNLPSKGFIAGGSLANTINKLKWGGKCVINDIDIFLIDEIKEYSKKEHVEKRIPVSYTTKKTQSAYKVDNYSDRLFISKIEKGDDYITIKTSTRDGIFNNVIFDTNKLNYHMFLETFDINCTQVGYDLENGVAYWTKDFEHYINTKELKVTLPNTPSHTALRILKKRDELEAKLDIKSEFQFLSFANLEKIKGRKKVWFGEKYRPLFVTYKEELSEYFSLHAQQVPCIKPYMEGNRVCYRKEGNENFNLFRLIPKDWELHAEPEKYKDFIIDYITLDEFAYYWRNIRPDGNKKMIWKHLQQFYKNNSYLNDFPLERANEYELKFISLKETVKEYPSLLKWLENKTLIEQLKYVEILFDVCAKNPELYDVLKFHTGYVSFENKDELIEKLQIFKIRYRKHIYKNKQNNNMSIDMF
jgi:hypothetical protein